MQTPTPEHPDSARESLAEQVGAPAPELIEVDPTRGTRPARVDRLSREEWLACSRAATRLAAEFGKLIDALPPEARHASGMARFTGVLRVTCQRLSKAIRDGDTSPRMLAELPGVEGLEQLVNGCSAAGIAREHVEAAMSAVEAYRTLIRQIAGSRSRLIDRLSLGEPGTSDRHPDLAGAGERRALFDAAARITGRRCRVGVAVYAFRPCPEDANLLERAMAKGMLGARVSPGGMPLLLSAGDTTYSDDAAHRLTLANKLPAGGRTPEAILRPFTTSPLPTVTTRSKSGTIRQVVDAQSANGKPIDIFTAMRATSPMFQPNGTPSLESVWSLVNCPSENLVLDVYIHRSIERRYRPALDAHLWNTDLAIPADERWTSRLPASPRLQMLGTGLGNASSALYANHAEMTGYFFDYINWDASEFVGFRCEAEYPVWRAGYCMSFEYLDKSE